MQGCQISAFWIQADANLTTVLVLIRLKKREGERCMLLLMNRKYERDSFEWEINAWGEIRVLMNSPKLPHNKDLRYVSSVSELIPILILWNGGCGTLIETKQIVACSSAIVVSPSQKFHRWQLLLGSTESRERVLLSLCSNSFMRSMVLSPQDNGPKYNARSDGSPLYPGLASRRCFGSGYSWIGR